MAVALTAPEAFRYTFPADPERHVRAAELLAGGPVDGEPAERLPTVLVGLIHDLGLPNGIGALGYTDADVDVLVHGALQQQRLLAISPRPVGPDDLAGIMRRSLTLWS